MRIVAEVDVPAEFPADHFDPVLEWRDGHQAASIHLEASADPHIWFQVKSWDPNKRHPAITKMLGRRIRVTVEVLED